MDMIFILSIFFGIVVNYADAAACTGNNPIGESNPSNNNLDTTTGATVLADDSDFTIGCCGVIDSWEFYAKANTGTVYLQVWRNNAGTYNLVGENLYTVTATNNDQTVIPTGNKILVDTGDILGFHQPGAAIVSHKPGNSYRMSTTYTQGTASYNWNSDALQTGRKYQFHARLGPTTAPSFTNNDVTVTYVDTTAVGSTLHTVAVNTPDAGDTITTIELSNSNPAMFQFDSSTMLVTTKQAVSSGTYTLKFKATNGCQQSATGTLTISISNTIPVINNLPASYDLSETHSTELTLLVISTTDPTDTVTCSITNPVTSPFDTKLSPGTSNYAIYLKAGQTMNYLTQQIYTLTIQCTDGKDPVTSTFSVYLLKNGPPSFTNLQNRTSTSTSTANNVNIFTVTADDPESDTLSYRLTCASCPFTINNLGVISTTSALSSITTPAYDLDIYVRDSSTETGPRTLTVLITDINTPPIITNLPLPSSNVILVRENTQTNSLLYKVKVLDVNPSDTLTFTVASSPIAGLTYIDINTTTGEVRTSAVTNIDYEDMSSAGGAGTTFTLTVYVSDDKGGSVSANLVITAININETPYFSKNVYGCHGNENTVGNTLSDPGISVIDPEGDTLIYRMDCGQYAGYFSMDSSTAAITITTAYDRDVTTNPSVISCTTTATDGEFTATATVQITIDDVNDNSPAFSQSFYTFYISPTESVNTVIGTLPATDADSGNFGTVTYSINQTVLYSEYFGMTGSSLYVKSSLSSFSDGQIITISAVVTDGGGLQDKATVYLIMAETTTVTVTTTTTERFYTFFEDSRNTAWFTLFMVGFISAFAILGYIFYKYFRTKGFDLKNNPKDEINRENYKRKQAKVQKMWEPDKHRPLPDF